MPGWQGRQRGFRVSFHTMKDQYIQDRIRNFGLLVVFAVLVHVMFTFQVRPVAASWQEREKAAQAADPDYLPKRLFWVIIKDPEQ